MRIASAITLLLAFLGQAVWATPWGPAGASVSRTDTARRDVTTCQRCGCECNCCVAAPAPARPNPTPETPPPARRTAPEELVSSPCLSDFSRSPLPPLGLVDPLCPVPFPPFLRTAASPLFLRGCALLI